MARRRAPADAHPRTILDTGCAAYDAHLLVDENATRLREPFRLIDRSFDFDGDGTYAEFQGPDWVPDWVDDDVQILWRSHDQLDATALVLIGPDSTYEATDNLPFIGRLPGWDDAPRIDVPAGWERQTLETMAGILIRYDHVESGVALVLVADPTVTDDIEARVLIPTADSLGSAS